MQASSHGHLSVVSLLLDSGVNVNFGYNPKVNAECTGSYTTALSAALYSHRVDIAEIMLVNGANTHFHYLKGLFEIKNKDGERYGEYLETFISTTWHATPMHKACFENDLPSLATLLADSSCVNIRDHNDWTPLHVAAVFLGRVEAAQLLLDNGANIFALTARGHSTLHLVRSPLVGGQRGQMIGLLLKLVGQDSIGK